MIPFKLSAETVSLDSWGTPEDLGAETLSGNPKLSGLFQEGGPDTPVSAGLYQATHGTFKVVYPFSEHATILEGEVILTDDSGNSVTYGPGDSWFVSKGETIIWDIKSDFIRKSFIAVS
ncbi:cupin domain-containing protein [Curvivirga sp.]|uniref:cupin domain-containing protein n=1 Tax=Curvivirga sp. TaxID=2856848 RepID=UPI003B5CA5FE